MATFNLQLGSIRQQEITKRVSAFDEEDQPAIRAWFEMRSDVVPDALRRSWAIGIFPPVQYSEEIDELMGSIDHMKPNLDPDAIKARYAVTDLPEPF